MNKEGNVLGSCAKLYDSREGFEQFCKDDRERESKTWDERHLFG